MRKGLLLLYEKETDYATHFTDYFNELPDFIFEIRTFTNLQVMNEYLEHHEADILLVSEDISLEEWQEKKAKKVIRLIEELEAGTEQPTIYKYQSMEQIKIQLIKIWGEKKIQTIKTSDCIAICSPFGGSGKTLFSLAYGQVVTKKRKTLYIGMESIKSVLNLEKGGGSFSDLLYFLKEKSTDFHSILQKLVIKIGELDCICSPDCCNDLSELKREDIDFLMEQLNSQTEYEVILFDIGIWNESTMYLLSKMDKIYELEGYTTTFFQMQKERVLEENWSLNGYEKPETFVEKLKLPYDEEIKKGEFKLERLFKTKMGQWIWTMLESELMKEKRV